MVAVTRTEFAALVARVEKLEGALEPTPAREVQVSAVPSDGAVQVSWTATEASAVKSFRVGRGGVDATGSGPWAVTEPATVRGRLFTKLSPGVEYTFTVAATYGDGSLVKAEASATPLGEVPAPVDPSDDDDPDDDGSDSEGSRDRVSGLPWESGAFTEFDAAKAVAFGRDRGTPLDHVAVFTTRDKGWAGQLNDWWKNAIPDGAGVTIGLPLWPQGSSIEAVAAGKDDGNWSALARQIAAVDQDAWVRLAWEMNVGQYWKITPGNRDVWVKAWRRAADVMLDAAPGLRIGWNPNAGPDQAGVNTRDVFAQVADLCTWIGPDSYDCWPPLVDEGGQAVHLGYLGEYLALARAHGIRLAVPEWGVSSGTQWAGHQGADNPQYIQVYLDFFAAHAGDVAFESYFSESQPYVRSALTQNPKAAAAYRQRLTALRAA